jgi:hypothetical protein
LLRLRRKWEGAVNVSRCGECNMPSTSGPLYVSGRRALCGMCLWAENADLKRRVRLARRKLAPFVDDDPVYLVNVAYRALDLRKPLPRRKR